jgi:glycosyltransferase involved in cell wall biosynthesis
LNTNFLPWDNEKTITTVNYMISKMPKILLITSSSFNSYTGTGITLSNLFQGWPLEKIAIIHQDKFQTNTKVCQHEYKLGEKEENIFFPFSIIVKPKLNNGSRSGLPIKSKKESKKYIRHRYIKKLLRSNIGDYDLFKKRVLSDDLKHWIDDFNPDILYLHISSLGFLRFAKRIIKYCKVPYVVHFMDDFYHFNYAKGLLGPFLRNIWKKEMHNMILNSDLRIGISEKMAMEYSDIFSAKFYSFFNVIDIDKWDAIKSNCSKSDVFNIIYAGTINNKNNTSLNNFASIVEGLKIPNLKIKFFIYSFQPRIGYYQNNFKKYKNTIVDEVPEGDKIIPLLKNSDLLFLPVDFMAESISRMRYSMFTKIPAYMISGVPILFWGPDGIASTEYAKKSEWAYVVSQNDPLILKQALLKLINDKYLRKELCENAKRLALNNHSSEIVRPRFHELIKDSVKQIHEN